MKTKQIAIAVAIMAVMGYLYVQPLKALTKEDSSHDTPQNAQAGVAPAANVTVETVSTTAKAVIGEGLSVKINDLEAKLQKASTDAEKTDLEKQLAKSWDDVNQPAPAAFYYLTVARKEKSFSGWMNAGNRFNEASKLSADTAAAPVFVSNAVEAFQNATKMNPSSLDAKTGLGVAYVNGGAMPMQGIALLREVVDKDPNNVSANLNLGLFSMKSGQYDKAVQRFKTLIAIKPDFEAYFYLAESYKQIGKKPEAIAAYQKCKELMPDPSFTQRIDQYIKELQN
jgi:tetratricopeptide (TPR) repeat protein